MSISFGYNPQIYANGFDTLQSFGHGLKMCISFGYNPQIIFVTHPTVLCQWF